MQKVISKPIQIIRQYHRDAVIVEHTITEADKENVRRLKKESEIDISYNIEGKLTISTWSYIGTVEFSNFILDIVPSFGTITEIGWLYNFAYKVNPVRLPGTVKFTDEYNRPLEELVRSFVDECKKIFTVGLYKSYQIRDESIPILKGKLILKQQIINQSKFNLKFHCEYDEFTSNNLENMIILDCLKICQRITKDDIMKMDIHKMFNQMSVEVEIKNVELNDFKKLRYTRLNQHYRGAHIIAKSIIMQKGFMNWNQLRSSFIPSIFMQTWELFEQLVTKLFEEYYPLIAKGQEESTSWKKYDNLGNMAGRRKIKPDIIVYKKSGFRDENVAFIADAKLKDDPNSENFYQVSSYLNKFGIKKGYILMPQAKKMENIIEIAGTWKSEGQDLEIQEILFDVDGILEFISAGRDDEIEKRLLELIPLKDFT